AMCTGKCAKCIGGTLYPLAAICLICNIILFFPGWSTEYVQGKEHENESLITNEVKYMGGLIGGGIMVLIPAIHIHATGKRGCCGNRCGMFLSIAFATLGVIGSLYSFVTATLGLVNGPLCEYTEKGLLVWGTPFKSADGEFNNESYLFNKELWKECVQPKGVVEFNVILFSLILAASGIEMVLCLIQMINGLFGCLCGTCGEKGRSFAGL
uniref:Transmembrane 4 L six family member 21b n=1 Tax=Lepisosteus oculatus TaxID=7918 RepID=W5N9I1_LEPOC